MSVSRAQRYSKAAPCPICGGFDQAPRGEGRRCWGFRSDDGAWAHCAREEYAGPLPLHDGSGTYAHRLTGDCRCGRPHGGGSGTTPSPRLAAVPRGKIIATYDYRDAKWELLFQVVRTEPKGFWQRRPHPTEPGRWINGLGGREPVLYRLPELLAADPAAPVFLPEGEKHVDALRALGLVATTSPMGAPAKVGIEPKWRPSYTPALKGRTVILLPDQDDVGRYHMETIGRALAGVAREVRTLTLPGLAEKGDVLDWLAAGGTRAELERLAVAAPVVEATPAPQTHVAVSALRYLDQVQKGLPPAIPVPYPSLAYLLNGGFRPGQFIVLGGEGGLGKSAFALELARHAAAQGTGTLVLSREMGLAELSARFLAQAARVKHDRLQAGRLEVDDWSRLAAAVTKADDLPLWFDDETASLEALVDALERWPHRIRPELIVVDYFQLLAAPKGIRDRLEQLDTLSRMLKGLARSRRLVLLVLSALNRTSDQRRGRPGAQRLRGTGQLEYDADILLFLDTEHPDRDERAVSCIVAKNRPGRVGIAPLRFRGEFLSFEEPADEGREAGWIR